MVIGGIPDVSIAESLLNNLAEADFDNKDISVVMKDQKSVSTIADVTGSLTGSFDIKRLEQLEISDKIIKGYQKITNDGGVLIAISAIGEAEKAAKEMLQDSNAQLIQIIH